MFNKDHFDVQMVIHNLLEHLQTLEESMHRAHTFPPVVLGNWWSHPKEANPQTFAW